MSPCTSQGRSRDAWRGTRPAKVTGRRIRVGLRLEPRSLWAASTAEVGGRACGQDGLVSSLCIASWVTIIFGRKSCMCADEFCWHGFLSSCVLPQGAVDLGVHRGTRALCVAEQSWCGLLSGSGASRRVRPARRGAGSRGGGDDCGRVAVLRPGAPEEAGRAQRLVVGMCEAMLTRWGLRRSAMTLSTGDVGLCDGLPGAAPRRVLDAARRA